MGHVDTFFFAEDGADKRIKSRVRFKNDNTLEGKLIHPNE